MILVFELLSRLFLALQFLLMVWVLLSYMPTKGLEKVYAVLSLILDPLLNPVKKMLKHSIFGTRTNRMDLTPFVAFLLLSGFRHLMMVVVASMLIA